MARSELTAATAYQQIEIAVGIGIKQASADVFSGRMRWPWASYFGEVLVVVAIESAGLVVGATDVDQILVAR